MRDGVCLAQFRLQLSTIGHVASARWFTVLLVLVYTPLNLVNEGGIINVLVAYCSAVD